MSIYVRGHTASQRNEITAGDFSEGEDTPFSADSQLLSACRRRQLSFFGPPATPPWPTLRWPGCRQRQRCHSDSASYFSGCWR